jgi:hypothetical protein
MIFPKVKFEPTFTIGNAITLALLIFASIGGWFDMRGSVKEVAQKVTADKEQLMFRIEAERQLTQSALKNQDIRIEAARGERTVQIQLHEQRISTIEKAVVDLAQFTRVTGQLQIEIKNLTETVKELKDEVKALRNSNNHNR